LEFQQLQHKSALSWQRNSFVVDTLPVFHSSMEDLDSSQAMDPVGQLILRFRKCGVTSLNNWIEDRIAGLIEENGTYG
jgi:hypothetical protein